MNAIVRHRREAEQIAIEQARREEADRPAMDAARIKVAEWNKSLAVPSLEILQREGITIWHCAECHKKLKPTMVDLIIAPGKEPPAIGASVVSDIGTRFRYIGAIRFSVKRRMISTDVAGTIVARCPTGGFGPNFPFCTAGCGVDFGRKAWKAGYR